MKINPNTTILDVAYNLSGSLAGIPAILSQLPTGERIGFDNMPEVWEDVPVDRYGQTWTPDLDGLDVELSVEVYNTPAVNKAPYSTDLVALNVASIEGNTLLPELLDIHIEPDDSDKYIRFTDLEEGESYTIYGIRVLNQTDPIYCDSYAGDGDYNPYYTVEGLEGDSPYFEMYFNMESFRFLLGELTLVHIPWYTEELIDDAYYNTFLQSVDAWGFDKDLSFDSPVTIFVTSKTNFDDIDYIAPPNAWTVRDNVFVKIKP